MAILKNIFAIIVLSLLVIMAMMYAQKGLEYIILAHDWVAEALTSVFSGGDTGNLIRKLLALLAIPLALGLIPTLIYGITRKKLFPYFMHVVWITWLIQTAAIVAMMQ